MTDIAANLQAVEARIHAAARRAGRQRSEITLVAVTKGVEPEEIRVAYDLGLRDLGENRVEEAETKALVLPSDIAWHMIGHIQSRKARRAAHLFRVVHSVDSLDLALRLDRFSSEQGKKLPVLIECNVSGEQSKFGLPAAAWSTDESVWSALLETVSSMVALPHLEVVGLMTMAPIVSHPEHARPVFSSLRQLRDELRREIPMIAWHHLSMGMTDDFEVAIEEGATLVRIGRAIFAPDRPALCGLPAVESGALV